MTCTLSNKIPSVSLINVAIYIHSYVICIKRKILSPPYPLNLKS